MARNAKGLTEAIAEIQELRREFWSDVRVPGEANEFNPELEKAGRVVQETVADTPIVALYAAETRTGTAFDRRLDGQTLDFTAVPGAPALFQDRQTGSQWTVEGRAVAGSLAGKQLTRVFSLQSEWYGWSAYFPKTTIYSARP